MIPKHRQRRLANLASETAAEHLNSVLNALLPGSTVITIDELKEAYVDKLKSEDSRSDCNCEEEYEPEFAWNIDYENHDKYWNLWMSPDESASRYSGKDVIVLRLKPVKESDNLHECWHVSMDGNDKLAGSLFAGPMYGFDAMVFRLATGMAKLKANAWHGQAEG